MFKKIAAALLIGMVWAGYARAVVEEQLTDKVKVSLYTQYDEVNPAQNLGILLKFQMADGWHIFSRNTEVGMPTKLEWRLPDGVAVSEIGWSRDEEFETDGIIQRGFGNTAYYQALLSHVGAEPLLLKLKVKWLACREECVPEQKIFEITLPSSPREQLPTTAWKNELQAAEPWFLPAEPAATVPGIWWILLLAFGGGIIMNAMPCIFPILAIKIIALAQTSYNRRKNRLEALFYTLGVVLCFAAVATVLLLLRLQGEHIGWGFQLQSPWFVGIMAIIFVIIGLLLLDIITFKNPFADRTGRMSFANHLLNSFMIGLLAVLIASPCTAPFMGIAIGYTLSAPVYMYYPVFLALGLGYALPFALAGMFPKAIHKVLPRPGKWMLILQKMFAIPVFLTAAWLLWVLYNQLAPQKNETIWQPYSPEAVAELTENGEPVFVDFTAKWCLTCLMNKRNVLDTQEFAQLAKQHNLHLFRADWTNNDELIGQALESYGRNSIPLYVYYNGKTTEYKLLPQLLTYDIVNKELDF